MKFEFDEDACVASQGVTLDVIEGTIRPLDVLGDSSQIRELEDALGLVNQFIDQLESSGIIEEY
ncbi:MAG: hypothetical protein GY928_30585 [Colwellia sp.]|nr:hypothetical protein [Colwellia sp.]